MPKNGKSTTQKKKSFKIFNQNLRMGTAVPKKPKKISFKILNQKSKLTANKGKRMKKNGRG